VVAPTLLAEDKESRVDKRGPEMVAERTGPRTNPTKRYKFGTDALGKIVQSSLTRLAASSSWQEYVASCRGPSHISHNVSHLQHPARDLLV
jgi:hypothetical protein